MGQVNDSRRPTPVERRWIYWGAATIGIFSSAVIASGQPVGIRALYLSAGALSGALLGWMMGDEYEDGGRLGRALMRIAAVLFTMLAGVGVVFELL